MIKKIDINDYPIAGALNIFIFIFAASLQLFCLYMVEEYGFSWQAFFFIILFSFINNTLFSLFHEAVHGAFHSNRSLNTFFGRLCAFFFPTSFSLQQIYHLGHHRRNRTDDEMFDLYYEGDKLWLKKLTIFGIMSGIYWSTAFLSCLLFFFAPNIFQSKSFIRSRFNKAFNFDAMLEGATRKSTPALAIRIEILLMIVFWGIVFYSLNLSFSTWIICYWCFGINWGSLQYTDHAFSKRDIRNGAWNLKVNPIIRAFFLNYHYHLVHHRYPNLPWIHLHKFVSKDEEMPSFISIYIRLWKGPEKTAEKCPMIDRDFEKSIYSGTPYSS